MTSPPVSPPLTHRLHIRRLVIDARLTGSLSAQQLREQVEAAVAQKLAGASAVGPQRPTLPMQIAEGITARITPVLTAQQPGGGRG